MKPEIKYTTGEGISLAYQTIGTGQIDIIFMPGWISNIDLMWNQSEFVKFINELCKIARVIIFDERGTGLSDRVDRVVTIEERVADIQTIMHATQSKKAVLIGQWNTASAAVLFAQKFPEHVISMILISPHSKGQMTAEHPWALSDDHYKDYIELIKQEWGNASTFASLILPQEKSGKLLEWINHYYRCNATPKEVILSLLERKELDITKSLDQIKTPTLIMAMDSDIHVGHEEVAFVSRKINHSLFVTLTQSYPLFWAVSVSEMLSYIKPFIHSNLKEIVHYNSPHHLPNTHDIYNFKSLVTKLIENNLNDQNFKVSDLAKELSVSPRQLQRNFKKFLKQSPSQFITHKRLNYAKKLLDHTYTNPYLSAIAFQSGFTDPSYFSKCFKKAFGVTPSDYIMAAQRHPRIEYLHAS